MAGVLNLFTIYDEGDRLIHIEGADEESVWNQTFSAYQQAEGRIDFEVIYDNVDGLWRGLVVYRPVVT